MQKLFLSNMVEEKKEEFAITTNISVETVRTRMKRGKLDPKHPGTRSPLYFAELDMVLICIQMAKVFCPLTGTQGSTFFNAMIKNTPTQLALAEFQEKLSTDPNNHGTAGLGWWRGRTQLKRPRNCHQKEDDKK